MADEQGQTIPGTLESAMTTAPVLTIAPIYKDLVTGALYVHRDLAQVIEPWADEAHKNILPPVKAAESFGDVESWAGYIKRFGDPALTFATWNSAGLRAVLDYHDEKREPGRCQWTAAHGFQQAPQLAKWTAFISGQRDQKAVIEFLEDMADTIVTPSAADITGLLSTLRSNISSKSEVTLRPDGGSSVEYSKESKVTGKGEIPPVIGIRVPVLAGHVNADGAAVVYDLPVRMRVSPGENGVTFRFSIPSLTATQEAAYADRVNAAREALGDGYPILRASN